MEHYIALEDMTAEEAVAKAGTAPAVILPLASVEMLGKHGPVGLDLKVARLAAEAVAKKTGAVAAPAIPYGDTMEFGALPGTVHIDPKVLEEYVYETARCFLNAFGAKRVLFLSAHSLDNIAAKAVCRRLKTEGFTCLTADWWAAVGANAGDVLKDPAGGKGHGSEMITSVGLYVCPECMHPDRAVEEAPKPGLARVTRWNGTPFSVAGTFSEYCESGAWGNMKDATAEKGEILFARAVEAIAAFLTDTLKGDTNV